VVMSKPPLLIPGYYCVGVNMHAKVHDAIKGVPKIVTWDQSLMTVGFEHYNIGRDTRTVWDCIIVLNKILPFVA